MGDKIMKKLQILSDILMVPLMFSEIYTDTSQS